MDYIECMEKSIDYIEQNILKKMSLKEISSIAGFSEYHFHRLFKVVTGDCLKEYIRGRRLKLASLELIKTDIRILDIALKYQFGSQESFTRAFKKVYGKTPAIYRNEKKNLTYHHKNKIDFNKLKCLEETVKLEYNSITEKELKVVGIEYIEKYNEVTFNEMLTDFISKKELIKEALNFDVVIGICHYNVYDFDPDTNEIHFLFCIEVEDFVDIPQGMVSKIIPRRNYLTFIHSDTRDKIFEVDEYIYGKFLPKSDYKLLEGGDLMMFDYTNNNETRFYVPICSKRKRV